jgi:hypothetical protein
MKGFLCGPWAPKTGLGQIDIALDSAQGLVVDGFFVAQSGHRVTLGLQCFPGQFLKVR